MTGPLHVPAVAARYAYASDHGVRGRVCLECGEARTAMEFVHILFRRDTGRTVEERPHCTSCVAAGRVSKSQRSRRLKTHGLTRDLFHEAETILYPGVRYHLLSADERRHCYIVARRWWLASDFWKVIERFDYAHAVAQVDALTDALTRRGLPVVIPPSPIHAHVDAHH